MENLRSGELYVFSDNEFFNPPSYAVVSGWACDGISLSVLMTESPLPEPSMRIDWDCRLPHGLSYSRLPTDAERDRFFRMLKVCDSQQKLVEHCFADHGDRCEIRFKRVFLRPAALGECVTRKDFGTHRFHLFDIISIQYGYFTAASGSGLVRICRKIIHDTGILF